MLLDVTNGYYMLSSVVACNLELLHAMQCCYMLPRFINYVVALHARTVVQC